MESLSKLAALCSEITVILAALAMLIKPIRNKLLGLDKLIDAHQKRDRRVGGDFVTWWQVFLIAVCVLCAVVVVASVLAILAHWLEGVRKRDKYVWAAIFNLTWYCIVSLVLTANDKIVPDSLTVAWFAAWTAELALLANIKIKGKDE